MQSAEIKFEREFFRGVTSWLICRHALMGGKLSWKYDKVSWMIGELAEYAELHLMCKEEKEKREQKK